MVIASPCKKSAIPLQDEDVAPRGTNFLPVGHLRGSTRLQAEAVSTIRPKHLHFTISRISKQARKVFSADCFLDLELQPAHSPWCPRISPNVSQLPFPSFAPSIDSSIVQHSHSMCHAGHYLHNSRSSWREVWDFGQMLRFAYTISKTQLATIS